MANSYHNSDPNTGRFTTSNPRTDGSGGHYVSTGNKLAHSTYLYDARGNYEGVKLSGYSRVSSIFSALLGDTDKK